MLCSVDTGAAICEVKRAERGRGVRQISFPPKLMKQKVLSLVGERIKVPTALGKHTLIL